MITLNNNNIIIVAQKGCNFQITVKKPSQKLLLQPSITGANIAINQSEVLEITCNFLKAWGNTCLQGVIGCTSPWLKLGATFFKQSISTEIVIT